MCANANREFGKRQKIQIALRDQVRKQLQRVQPYCSPSMCFSQNMHLGLQLQQPRQAIRTLEGAIRRALQKSRLGCNIGGSEMCIECLTNAASLRHLRN